METVHAQGSPLAAYLEGEGTLDPDRIQDPPSQPPSRGHAPTAFAPTSTATAPALSSTYRHALHPLIAGPAPISSPIARLHNAWSIALNSRLGRADNDRFIEHFRYILVASQLVNEYLDQGSLQTAPARLSNSATGPETAHVGLFGALATALAAFVVVYIANRLLHGRGGAVSTGRVVLTVALFGLLGLSGYGYVRRQWLQYLRKQAVAAASNLTGNWQSFELSSGSALTFIQEVELVSKGYRISTPLAPASRIEDVKARRCERLRSSLQKAYAAMVPACIDAFNTISSMVGEDELEKYYEVYDISLTDAREACAIDAPDAIDDDAKSIKSLRLYSCRAAILRRITLCALLSLKADGGKPDFHRWSVATEAMQALGIVLEENTSRLRTVLGDMEHIPIPPPASSPNASRQSVATREKMRSQVRKISMLSSGIRGLQAKMQVLREETNRAIEQSDDLSDSGPDLMAQYDSIGVDLKELVGAWEQGKAILASNLTRQERRISLASSGRRSPLASPGVLAAVEESSDGSPAAALRALTAGGARGGGSGGGTESSQSNRSSLGTTVGSPGSTIATSDDEVFETVAVAPSSRIRSTLSREERIAKMHEERERLASVRASKEANTSMLRELETVINLRPRPPQRARTSGARMISI